jgi:hypothetical protein
MVPPLVEEEKAIDKRQAGDEEDEGYILQPGVLRAGEREERPHPPTAGVPTCCGGAHTLTITRRC